MRHALLHSHQSAEQDSSLVVERQLHHISGRWGTWGAGGEVANLVESGERCTQANVSDHPMMIPFEAVGSVSLITQILLNLLLIVVNLVVRAVSVRLNIN